jgi:hypothetical protein
MLLHAYTSTQRTDFLDDEDTATSMHLWKACVDEGFHRSRVEAICGKID